MTPRNLTLLALLLAGGALAQSVPATVTFTARLVDNGVPAQGSKSFLFKLYPTLQGGTEVWSETQTLTVTDGVVNAQLGASMPLSDTVFSGATLYLEVTVDSVRLDPRTAVVSQPYAIRAGVSGKVGALAEADIQRRVSTACPAGSSIRALAADGTPTCETTSVTFDGGGLYLPVGTALTCNAGEKVVGISSATGNVACLPDATGLASEVDGVVGNEVLGSTDTTLTRSGAGTAGSPFTLGVNTAVMQSRVGGTCGVGSSIRAINADGTVVCQLDNTGIVAEQDAVVGNEVLGATDTTLTRSGAGTTAAPFTLGVNTNVMQSRVNGACGVGSSIRAIAADGTVTCQADTTGITQLNAGTGLAGGGTAATVTLGIATGGVTATELGTGAVTTAKIATGVTVNGTFTAGYTTVSNSAVISTSFGSCPSGTGTCYHPGTAGVWSGACPAGTNVIGGGCDIQNYIFCYAISSHPYNNGWRCTGVCWNQNSNNLVSTAICARIQ